MMMMMITRGSLHQVRRPYTVSLLLHFNTNTPFTFFI